MKKVFLTIVNICLIVFIGNAQDVVKKANNFIDLLGAEQTVYFKRLTSTTFTLHQWDSTNDASKTPEQILFYINSDDKNHFEMIMYSQILENDLEPFFILAHKTLLFLSHIKHIYIS